ncbi:protein fem-1 homolog B-like [Prorops nasuta]|uniref:protein fem-1 homolog B-like n=1 Tax=Prorops nasuta TaxID=863751 RepID=UPI0034CDA375
MELIWTLYMTNLKIDSLCCTIDGVKMSFETKQMDETRIEESKFSESLIKQVYYAARDGMAIVLYTLLSDSDKTIEDINWLINQKVLEENGQRCTPLIVAARYGHNRVVKMLLQKFKPDLEQEGTVEFDGFFTEGASALWCAAGAGYLNAVKTLINAGADVNHSTKNRSTPLRAACFSGYLDIVKYLVEHKADIHIPNKFNNTCLMISAYKGHSDIVNFLLDNGAKPNVTARCGGTALHYAAECGHANIVLDLLKFGAEMIKNESGMTPLITAAERMRVDVLQCFIRNCDISINEIIDAYELLGASYANDKDNYNLEKAYDFLVVAMVLRYTEPNNVVHKKLGEPIKAYENWRESETLERLKSIQHNHNALHMESLAIRERILGSHNPEVPHAIIFRGAVFADNARFDRCIDLWLHALKLRQLNKVHVIKDLLQFAQVFSQMIHVGVEVDFQQVLSVFEASVIELSRNKASIQSPDCDCDVDINYLEKLESNIMSTLYILTILTKLITLNESTYSEADINKAYYIVYKLCSLRVTLRDGQTLLHLAVNPETPVDDFHTNDVCKFPCAATTKLLIRCGADVNAMDNKRNTPLHLIVSYRKPISDFTTLHTIIMELIEAGAHMDTVNSKGKTPYDAVTTGVAEIILRTQTKLSLQCMAAKAVKTYNLPYSGKVTPCLESFIELHGPGLNQG